jgi:geranylgeranyl reductase family protein
VLVVGAGPAGATAARALARSGIDVVLADQCAFPREKVCGDALISDALGALSALGIYDRVLAQAARGAELKIYAPNGAFMSFAGEFACMPREHFDTMLVDAAIKSGARFLPGLTAVAPLERAHAVSGARFRHNGTRVEIRAKATLLATGANPSALRAFGLEARAKPSAVAGRAYYEVPASLADRYSSLMVAYHREWCPGYGWIFPGPQNRFNVGVGLVAGHGDGPRLREFWEFFRSRFAPARDLVRASRELAPFRGAPLRSGLEAGFGRPGLLAVGEAAHLTYPATGEGIGKAMESGLIAAAIVGEALASARALDSLHETYGEEFRRRFSARYAAYRTAQSWACHPLLLNFLVARANRGRFVRSEFEALIGERGDASALFSRRGFFKALTS